MGGLKRGTIKKIHGINNRKKNFTQRRVYRLFRRNKKSSLVTPMKNFTALFTIAAVALLCLAASVAAGDTLQNLTVLPEGTLHSGDSAFGSFVLTSNEPFTDEDPVTMETDLEDPAWIYIIEADGVEQVSSGIRFGSVTIPGYELVYPSAQNITIRVHFAGTAPTATEEKYINIVSICSSHTYPDHGVGSCTIAPWEIKPA
jgi:hypothetical protein